MMMAASCGAAVSWMLVALLLVSREALSLRHRLLPKTVQNSAPVRGYNYQTRFFDQKVWLRIHEVCARGPPCTCCRKSRSGNRPQYRYNTCSGVTKYYEPIFTKAPERVWLHEANNPWSGEAGGIDRSLCSTPAGGPLQRWGEHHL